MKALLFGVTALLLALPAAAQVGHEPAKSPYEDLEFNQELGVLFGYTRMRHDPASIAPRSAPSVDLRYEWSLVGPLALSSDVGMAFANRDQIDPSLPAATRTSRNRAATVTAADLALALNLTGRKSWHHLVPQIRGGLGFVHSPAADDSSGFSFGSPFAFTLGGGLKFVPATGRVQLRVDVTDRIFKLAYPDAYYRLASDQTSVLDVSTPRSFYTHHTALTIGVSYLFAR